VEAMGYVTVPDAADGAQLELRRQIAVMDAVCAERGWRLVEVARDVSDADAPFHRLGLIHALDRLAGSDRRCLIVANLRRLGSSARELASVLRWLRGRQVRLVAADVGLDTGAAEGRIAADALIGDVADGRPGRPAVEDLPEPNEQIVAMRPSSVHVAAGYRRRRRPSTARGVYDSADRRRRTEER
jgi:resolvase-like protein